MEAQQEIETKIAFIENSLENLNDIVTEQANEIDRLKYQLKIMKEKLINFEDNSELPQDKPPPHY